MAVRDELIRIITMEGEYTALSAEVLPRLNFDSGRRSVVREIEVEIERRKGDVNVF